MLDIHRQHHQRKRMMLYAKLWQIFMLQLKIDGDAPMDTRSSLGVSPRVTNIRIDDARYSRSPSKSPDAAKGILNICSCQSNSTSPSRHVLKNQLHQHLRNSSNEVVSTLQPFNHSIFRRSKLDLGSIVRTNSPTQMQKA